MNFGKITSELSFENSHKLNSPKITLLKKFVFTTHNLRRLCEIVLECYAMTILHIQDCLTKIVFVKPF